MGTLDNVIRSVGEILCLYENLKVRLNLDNIVDEDIRTFCKLWKVQSEFNYIPGSRDSTEFLFKKTIYHMCIVMWHIGYFDLTQLEELGYVMLCYYIIGDHSVTGGINLPVVLRKCINKYERVWKSIKPKKIYSKIVDVIVKRRMHTDMSHFTSQLCATKK